MRVERLPCNNRYEYPGGVSLLQRRNARTKRTPGCADVINEDYWRLHNTLHAESTVLSL